MRGAAAQGIGWALLEELIHDDEGQLLTGSFLDYALPRAAQVPDIDTLIVEVPAPDGPFGAKGIGEASVIPAGAAVASAIVAAGGPRLREMPMTPRRVWAASRSRDKGRSASGREGPGLIEASHRGPADHRRCLEGPLGRARWWAILGSNQ